MLSLGEEAASRRSDASRFPSRVPVALDCCSLEAPLFPRSVRRASPVKLVSVVTRNRWPNLVVCMDGASGKPCVRTGRPLWRGVLSPFHLPPGLSRPDSCGSNGGRSCARRMQAIQEASAAERWRRLCAQPRLVGRETRARGPSPSSVQQVSTSAAAALAR